MLLKAQWGQERELFCVLCILILTQRTFSYLYLFCFCLEHELENALETWQSPGELADTVDYVDGENADEKMTQLSSRQLLKKAQSDLNFARLNSISNDRYGFIDIFLQVCAYY